MRYLSLTILSTAVLFTSPAFALDEQRLDGTFSVSLGADYSSGDYGASIDTDVWALPVSVKYRTDKFSLRVSTAYLRVTGPSFVTPEGDFFNGAGTTIKSTEKGMGDINITGNYNFLDDRQYPVGMDLIARVKIPTANEKKFLGTGEYDFALKSEFFKVIGDWTPYWNIGYRWRGDQPGNPLKDVWSTSLGADFRVNNTYSVGLGFDWQERVNDFVDNAEEASAYVNYKLNDHNRMNIYVVGGFSDSSPNWGLGTTFTHQY